MPDSYVRLRYHLVWSTKHRTPWIDPSWRPRLFAYIAGIVRNKGGELICGGGVRDHVHLYLECSTAVPLAHLVAAIKANSTRWIRDAIPGRSSFRWQAAYAAFTVTPRDDAALRAYIRDQELHHRERDFAAEYVGFLEAHGISYDTRHALE